MSFYIWQMNDGRWHVSAETNAHDVYKAVDVEHNGAGFDTRAEAETARKGLFYHAAIAFDDLWMIEIARAFPGERAGDVRYYPKANGEPGTDLHAAFKRYAFASKMAGYEVAA